MEAMMDRTGEGTGEWLERCQAAYDEAVEEARQRQEQQAKVKEENDRMWSERFAERASRILQTQIPVESVRIEEDYPRRRVFEFAGLTFTDSRYQRECLGILERCPQCGEEMESGAIVSLVDVGAYLNHADTRFLMHHCPEPEPEPEPPKQRAMEEQYRVTELGVPHMIAKWLNEQYEQGYILHSISGYGSSFDQSAAYIVVRKMTAEECIQAWGKVKP